MVRSLQDRTKIRTQAIRLRGRAVVAAVAEAISFPQESMFLQARARARAPDTAVPTGVRAIRPDDHGSPTRCFGAATLVFLGFPQFGDHTFGNVRICRC
jgi:hypothetical protein